MSSTTDYIVENEIGHGSFGKVFSITRKSDGKQLVWKEMDYGKMSEREKEQLVSEVNILRELRHSHIVRYYDRIIDRDAQKIYVIMEFCPGGDLAARIKRCRAERRYIDEDTIWKIFTQLLLALGSCHNRESGTILHRDLKPGNVFLDKNDAVKLGDFGLARVLGSNSLFAHTVVGTPFYMSPEQVNQRAYNDKSDIWSLGCLIYELAALVPPFDAKNHMSLAKKIEAGYFSRIPSMYSDALQNTIASMLKTNQSRRPNVSKLLTVPQIALRVRERKVNQHYQALKMREEECSAREKQLAEREAELAARESRISTAEASLSSTYYSMRQQLIAAGLDDSMIPSFESLTGMSAQVPSSTETPSYAIERNPIPTSTENTFLPSIKRYNSNPSLVRVQTTTTMSRPFRDLSNAA